MLVGKHTTPLRRYSRKCPVSGGVGVAERPIENMPKFKLVAAA
jgi:hypothetical protein